MTDERLTEIEARDENMLNRDEMIADLLEHVKKLQKDVDYWRGAYWADLHETENSNP